MPTESAQGPAPRSGDASKAPWANAPTPPSNEVLPRLRNASALTRCPHLPSIFPGPSRPALAFAPKSDAHHKVPRTEQPALAASPRLSRHETFRAMRHTAIRAAHTQRCGSEVRSPPPHDHQGRLSPLPDSDAAGLGAPELASPPPKPAERPSSATCIAPPPQTPAGHSVDMQVRC